jgi:hypothetical protein
VLQRAWLLGPRHIGPNMLLAADGASRALFSVPPSQLVLHAKHPAAYNSSGAAAEDPGAAATSTSGSHHQHHKVLSAVRRSQQVAASRTDDWGSTFA